VLGTGAGTRTARCLEGREREGIDPEPRNDRREQTSAMRFEAEKPTRSLGVDLSAVSRI
jgi:hypothetical protein